jgi:hypothetical protein
MTRPRVTGNEWNRLAARLERMDELALDDGTASRLLSGNLPVDDAPPAHRRTAEAVAALTAPPRPHEVAAQQEAVIRLSHELAVQTTRKDHRRRQLRKGRRVLQLAATMMIGGAVLLGGLAAAGALPIH